jgi:hypothetical protein
MMSSTYNNRYNVSVVAIDEQRGVHLGLHKAQGNQVRGEVVVPSSGRLLQVVEELVELAHQVGVSGVNKAGRLAVVDRHSEGAVKEDVLDIQLLNGSAPRELESERSNGQGGGSGDRKGKNLQWTRAIVPGVTLLVARSFTDKPKGSNSMEHELCQWGK